MLDFQGALPFAAIADPEKKLYAEFAVRQMAREDMPFEIIGPFQEVPPLPAWQASRERRGGALCFGARVARAIVAA